MDHLSRRQLFGILGVGTGTGHLMGLLAEVSRVAGGAVRPVAVDV